MLRAAKFLEFIRWKDWALGKIPIFCMICFYIALAYRKFSISYIEDFFIFIVFASSVAIYGYLINDLGDRKLDLLHGKRNSFENLNRGAIALVFLVIICVMTLSAMAFVHRSWFLPLWLIQVFLSTSYSIPPFRFKERGTIGLIANFIAQFFLAVAVIFAAFGCFGGWDMIVFLICVTVSGVALEIGHQKYDFARDSQTETGTFAVRKGYDFTAKMYGSALQLDKLSTGILIAVMVVKIPWVTLPLIHLTITPILPLAIIYFVLYFQTMKKSLLRPNKSRVIDPYYSGKRGIFHAMHVLFPYNVMPIYLAGLMTCYYYCNLIIIIFFILWIILGRCLSFPKTGFWESIRAILKGTEEG